MNSNNENCSLSKDAFNILQEAVEKTGINIPEIMLPTVGTDLSKWSVIACDQYTSQPGYWEQVEKIVGENPSTFHLTLPEIFLKTDNWTQKIENINRNMFSYIDEKKLETGKPGFILVDRSTPHAPSRKGLIMAIDLEKYDYREGSQTLVRSTEGTVLDRIPPRVKIRENAPIELPHIMVLIDDPEKTVIEPLFNNVCEGRKIAGQYEKAYDFELMLGGGHIRGWKIEDEQSLCNIASALEKLVDPAAFRDKYKVGEEKGVLLFAVGDGNHSLASAKAHWENVKASLQSGSEKNRPPVQKSIPYHPARYALVEVVNVHDSGIVFEPIHRVLFGIDPTSVLDELCQQAHYKLFASKSEMEAESRTFLDSEYSGINDTKSRPHAIPFILEGQYGLLSFENPACSLDTGTLQAVLDELVKRHHNKIEIDYIHGDQVVTELGSKKGCMGFYMPVMDKKDLFRAVIQEGALPRKTFSMGEAEEKRYYLECRCIK